MVAPFGAGFADWSQEIVELVAEGQTVVARLGKRAPPLLNSLRQTAQKESRPTASVGRRRKLPPLPLD